MNLKRWWQTASTTARGGLIAAFAVVFICGCCGLASAAMNGGKSTTQAQGDTFAQQATNTPSGTATPTFTPGPTATPLPPTATPKPTRAPQWQTVKHFDGTASTQTESFSASGQWRIVWKCQKSDSFGGNFAATLYQDDGTYVDLFANTTDNDQGTWNAHNQDGQFYIAVDTYSESWSIDIQVYQ